MPMVNITMGPSSKEIKREIILKVAETIANVTGIPEDMFMIAISELPYDNLGIGTKTLSQIIESKKV